MGDLDGDGDLDLAAVEEGGSKLLHLMINHGDGSFRENDQAFYCGPNPIDLAIADLDGKGSLDLAAANHSDTRSVAVMMNLTETPPPSLPSVPGDANLDGKFDRFDIVHVLQAAKYLTGEAATWAEGDWDGNDVFDHLDIIYALQAGEYTP
jgi:hypothetical protein